MPDLFESPRKMIAWGKKRTKELGAAIDGFVKEEPWSYVVQPEPETGSYLHKIVFTDRVTEDLPNILFDAVNNLRPALDQIAFAIAVLSTGIDKPKHCAFPFAGTEADMANARGKCKDLPTEIIDVFVRFKPYERGNDALYTLNKLANTPKHMALVPMLVGGALIIGNRFKPPYQVVHKMWKRDSNEIEFFTTDVDCRLETEFKLTVSFDDIHETVRGKHPVGVLDAMAGEVERVLMCTEAECRRIGLIA